MNVKIMRQYIFFEVVLLLWEYNDPKFLQDAKQLKDN